MFRVPQYDPGPDGEIRWALNGSSTVTVRSSAMGPDAAAGISQRPIAEEPMVCLACRLPLGTYKTDSFSF